MSGGPHPVKACSHRNTHNAFQDYRLPLDCPFLGAFLAVHNTAITPISGSAGKIATSRAQTKFWRQNRRSRKGITGVWLAELGLSPHFRTRRVLEASIEYQELLAENPFEGIRIVDIIREGMTGDDPRLQ